MAVRDGKENKTISFVSTWSKVYQFKNPKDDVQHFDQRHPQTKQWYAYIVKMV